MKTILLTPSPVTIGEEWLEIIPKQEFSAIGGGAAIHVDITSQIENIKNFDEIERKFPNGTISGVLITASGKEIQINNSSATHSDKEARLILGTNGPMPTDLKFTKVKLKSKIEIKDTKIYWKNGKL